MSGTGSMRRKKLSLKSTLFIVILSVAVVCIATSVVLALVLAHLEVNKILERQPSLGTPQSVPGQVAPPSHPPGAPPEQRPNGSPKNPAQPLPTFPHWLWLVFLFSGLAGLAVALGLSLWMARRISRPLSELTETTSNIAEGEFGEMVKVTGGREIEALATAFNTLSEKLKRTEELRNNMVADIAHELRTPLTTLRCDFEAVKDGLLEPDPEVLNNLLGDIIVLSRLVEDLQELSLAEAGQLKLEMGEVDVKGVIDELAARFGSESAGRGVSLETGVDTGLPPIQADPLRIAQVLGNLVKNALIHTPEGGAVKIGASRSGREVVVTVSDNGPGIPEDDLPFIFERFCRLDRSRARKTGGSGLGLTIAKTIVDAHGGYIWAESEVGRGTRISFSVPIPTATG